MKYRFLCRDITKVLAIPHEFVDEHMMKANGEYIKVYLFMLRYAGKKIDTVDIADALNMTERDVLRAVNFWERSEIMVVKDCPDEENDDIYEKNMESPDEWEEDDTKEILLSKSNIDFEGLNDDEAFKALLYMGERSLGVIFTSEDCQSFAYMYDVLKLDNELIEYIVELSIKKGVSSVRYIEKVAIDYHKRGIKTIEQAKAESVTYSTEVYSVMRAFGIRDREPVQDEQELMQKWFKVYGFTKEMVVEACNRTMMMISKPSFRYADKILTGWYEKRAFSKDDIEKLDKEHQERVKKVEHSQKNIPKNSAPVVRKNTFNSFEQRSDELDSMALEKLKAKLRRKDSDE